MRSSILYPHSVSASSAYSAWTGADDTGVCTPGAVSVGTVAISVKASGVPAARAASMSIGSNANAPPAPDVTGAETYATVTALDESPLMRGKLFAGTDDGRVWMTEDDGGSWTELTNRISGAPEGHYVSRVKASNHDAGRVYVTFDGHRTNDLNPYVFVSDDNGGSFRSITADLPTGSVDFLHVIEEDPINEEDFRGVYQIPANVPTEKFYSRTKSFDRNATHLDDVNAYYPVDRMRERVTRSLELLQRQEREADRAVEPCFERGVFGIGGDVGRRRRAGRGRGEESFRVAERVRR